MRINFLIPGNMMRYFYFYVVYRHSSDTIQRLNCHYYISTMAKGCTYLCVNQRQSNHVDVISIPYSTMCVTVLLTQQMDKLTMLMSQRHWKFQVIERPTDK